VYVCEYECECVCECVSVYVRVRVCVRVYVCQGEDIVCAWPRFDQLEVDSGGVIHSKSR